MEISTKYNPKETEEKILKNWLSSEFFAAKPDSCKKPFCIVIPPPNITGILHMGHALNNTIQDVLIRFKRMSGFESLWMPGTDHAGIATQNVVEKDLAKQGLKKEDLGREQFLKRLWQWTDKYGSTILEQLKNLGASCDWQRARFTLDDEYSEAVKEAFIQLYDKGLIYRGNYIINWCPRCKTALSDEEAPRKEIDGWLYYIKYPVIKHSVERQAHSEYVVVATTRPETMLGDTAIAINPKDERYTWLKDKKIILPIMEREIRVIEDELVDLEFGTGAVKVTPAHDPLDFTLAKKHNLEFINIMRDDAVLNENAGEFANMDRFEARAAILEILEEKKLIEKKEPHKLSAGHCYRCHTMIEPRLSLQWFVQMKALAEPAIKAVEEGKIKFYPERWKKVYLNWMNNIRDWCISRQIWWGHRIPVYYCKKCQTGKSQIPNPKSQTNYKLQTTNYKEELGLIVSQAKPDKCPYCGSSDIYQDDDVLDTWFSSWLWPFATFYWPKFRGQMPDNRSQRNDKKELEYFYPTSVLVTASEILFFWVARMIMAGLEFMKEAPFKDVFIHGTVRDERGIKMSKSLGNIIDPLEIIDKFGADSLRFSLMLTASGGSDVYLSDEKFLVGRNFCNKVWNASRFILMKIRESNFKIENLKVEEIDAIDSWILEEFNKTIDITTAHLDNYRINEASKAVYEFFWHTFCDWYIEIVKDTFTPAKAEVLLYLLVNSIKLLHPFMPFITEEVFGLIKSYSGLVLSESLCIETWPQKMDFQVDRQKIAAICALHDTIGELRNIKTDLGIAQKKVRLIVRAKEEYKEFWQKHGAWIKRLAFLGAIELEDSLKRTLYKNEFWELNLDIEGLDEVNFIFSLDKKIANLNSVFEKINMRLQNENFLKNAPPETVEEEKIKFNEVSKQLKRLKELKDAFRP
jgi:valyl-tRNA synthetase